MDYRLILFALFSYVAGGVPSGYIIARALKGIDIREHGSGNPGAANVYRTVGPAAGWATMFFDSMKGCLPVLLVMHFFPDQLWVQMGCGGLAIAGHIWTVFLRFKGGKGVATSAGVFAALLPLPMLCSFVAFALAAGLSKHISVGSMCGAALLPVTSFMFGEPLPLTAMTLAVSLLILYKHIPNMQRLLAGRELHFEDNHSHRAGTPAPGERAAAKKA